MQRPTLRVFRLRWLGPLPRPGVEYLRPPRAKSVLRVERVIRSTEPTRAGAALVEIHCLRANPPDGAVIHELGVQRLRERLAERDPAPTVASTGKDGAAMPASRPPAPPRRRDSGAGRLAHALSGDREDADSSVPDRVKIIPRQQRVSGRAVRSEWDDPDDPSTTGGRKARQVNGYVRADPLVALSKRNSLVKALHIAAADRYRLAWERGPGGARSASGDRMERVDTSRGTAGSDPTMAAMNAMRRWIRVSSQFDERARGILSDVVLERSDVTSWAARNGWDRKHAIGFLIAQLDLLVKYFGLDRKKPASAV